MTSLDEETIGGLNRHFSDGLNDVINDERSGLMSHHSENSSEDQHAHSKSHVYSLFDLGGRGLLADKMEEALVKFNEEIIDSAIKEHVTPYLYNNGKGKWIPKNHLVSQRITEIGGEHAVIVANLQHRKIGQLVEPDQPRQKFSSSPSVRPEFREREQEESVYYQLYQQNQDPSGDRFCCWDIWRRGSMGETLLHVCLLCGSKIAREVALRLLKLFPTLVVDIYLGHDYYGQTPLHMALVNEDLALLKMMLDIRDSSTNERLADLSARCNGSFFMPIDLKQEINLNPKMGETPILKSYRTSYAGPCYWGEFPLSFAVCLGLEDAFIWLLHRGASPLATDLNGNNILHMLVIHNKLEMFKCCIELLEDETLSELMDERNRQDYIPLTLAAFCGRQEIFKLILSYQSKVLWIYGDLHAVEYLLTDLDTIRPDGSLNKHSALHIIAMNSKDSPQHLDMLSGVMRELVDWKWDLFGRQILLANFLVYFLFLISYLTGMYIRKPAPPTASGSESSSSCYIRKVESHTDYVLSGIEVWTYLQLLLRVVVEVRQFRTLGWKLWSSDLVLAPTKISFLMGVFFLIPLSLMLRIICQSKLEDYVCMLTVFCITPHILFYIRSTKCLGHLITVMYRAVTDDLRRFSIILSILLTAYSLGMTVLFKAGQEGESGSPSPSPFHNFSLTLYLSFCMVMGEVKPSIYDAIKESPYPFFTQCYWAIFFVLAHLLLVNVLVAMVYETFHVYKQSHHEWYKERTRLVVMYEYLLTDLCRKKVLHQYSQLAKRPQKSKSVVPSQVPAGQRTSSGDKNEVHPESNSEEISSTKSKKAGPKERKVTVKHYFRNGKSVGEILPNGDPRQ